MNLRADLTLSGIDHDWLILTNDSLINRIRNQMTATFLETQCSHMMWIDADIEFSTDDVVKLWNMQADIAVGVYAMKKRDEQWFAAWKDGELVKDLDRFDGPIEVDYAGTGFMMIARHVIESLAKTEPSYEGVNGQRIPALYMTPVFNDGLESEDYHFCRIAREAGFRVTMDPTVRLRHWGEYAYGQ